MALTATVEFKTDGVYLTVTSDRRKFTGTVASAGETAPFTGQWPVTVTDDSGRTWAPVSDDGVKAIYKS